MPLAYPNSVGFNPLSPCEAKMHQWTWPTLVQMALSHYPKPMLTWHQSDPKKRVSMHFLWRKLQWNLPMRKKLSPWAHGDHGGHGSGPNDHGSVTARRGHSSVTARSQLSHGEVTAQSRRGHRSITASSVWSRLGHSSITAQVMAQSRLAVTILVTMSSRWAVTMANFFLMGV